MKTKKQIFKDILASASTNCVLKIKVRGNPNPVITAIDRLSKNKIILKPTCLYGFPLKKQTLTLLEIESVMRYHANFNHPLFVKLRFIKNNIAAIRNNIETLDHGTAAV
jgi:hypothetical protein